MQKSITALAIAILFSVTGSYAQQANIGCNDKDIRMQAENLKQEQYKEGMVAFKDAMVSMESQQPYPIEIQLTKGETYKFIYVGSMNAAKLTFELFNGEDKRIEVQALKDPLSTNYLVYTFVPDKTDVYLVVLTQKWKTKSMCGSFTVMKKGDKKNTPAK